MRLSGRCRMGCGGFVCSSGVFVLVVFGFSRVFWGVVLGLLFRVWVFFYVAFVVGDASRPKDSDQGSSGRGGLAPGVVGGGCAAWLVGGCGWLRFGTRVRVRSSCGRLGLRLRVWGGAPRSLGGRVGLRGVGVVGMLGAGCSGVDGLGVWGWVGGGGCRGCVRGWVSCFGIGWGRGGVGGSGGLRWGGLGWGCCLGGCVGRFGPWGVWVCWCLLVVLGALVGLWGPGASGVGCAKGSAWNWVTVGVRGCRVSGVEWVWVWAGVFLAVGGGECFSYFPAL